MASAQKQLEKAFNKVVNEVNENTADSINTFLKEKLSSVSNDELDNLIEEYKKLKIKVSFGDNKKNPKKPRKQTAFNFYVKDQLQKTKDDNPDKKAQDCFGITSKNWKKESAKVKEKYEKMKVEYYEKIDQNK